jgi:hypothetical protein
MRHLSSEGEGKTHIPGICQVRVRAKRCGISYRDMMRDTVSLAEM